MSSISTDTSSVVARDVTDDECSAFHEHGWALLPELISEQAAADLLAEARRLMGDKATTHQAHTTAKDPGVRAHQASMFQVFNVEPDKSSLYAEFTRSAEMGDNAARLMSNPFTGLRQARKWGTGAGTVLVKMPQVQDGEATPWHQDRPYYPLDRDGQLIFWIALVPMTADMGTMQFVDGSHRLGVFGRQQIFPGADAIKEYPGIAEHCQITAPADLRAGDAHVFDVGTLHAAGVNRTDRERWACTTGFIPAEARYTGAPHRVTDDLGLEINGTFDHPNFPIVGTA